MALAKLLSFLLLIVASIVLHLSLIPFEVGERQLLNNPVFKDGMQQWQVFGSGDVNHLGAGITLTNGNPDKHVVVSQVLNVDQLVPDMFLTVEASSDDIRAGDRSWQTGRLIVVSLRGTDLKPDYEIPYKVFSLNGTNDWQKHRMFIHIYPGVEALALQLQLLNATGALSIRDLSLKSTIENQYWTLVQATMLSLFVIYLFWIFSPMLNCRCLDWASGLGLIVVVLIVVFTTIPMSLKNEIYSIFRQAAPALNEVLSWARESEGVLMLKSTNIFIGMDSRFFSVMHFLFFMTAAVLLLIGKSNITASNMIVNLVVVAVSTEAMQLFVMNRHGSVENALVDLSGIVAGGVIAAIINIAISNGYRKDL